MLHLKSRLVEHISAFCNTGMVIVYFMYYEEKKLPRTIIFFNFLIVARRSFGIAARYATSNPLRMQDNAERVFSFEENMIEYMLSGWIQCPPGIYDYHIHFSMVRLQIENVSFFYRNVQSLPQKRVQMLTDLESLKHL